MAGFTLTAANAARAAADATVALINNETVQNANTKTRVATALTQILDYAEKMQDELEVRRRQLHYSIDVSGGPQTLALTPLVCDDFTVQRLDSSGVSTNALSVSLPAGWVFEHKDVAGPVGGTVSTTDAGGFFRLAADDVAQIVRVVDYGPKI